MALSLPFWLFCQEPTVIRDYGGKRVVQDPSKYALVGTSSHQVIIEHYELISGNERDQLIDLIIQDIDYYMDRVMEISDGSMVVRKSDKQIMKDLKSIVDHKIKLYDYQVDRPFEGFSEAFNQKIKDLERLNWSTEDTRGELSYDSQEMALNYVRSQISELKDISTRDLSSYADAHIHEYISTDFPSDLAMDPGPVDTGEWVVNSPLIPIDYTLASIQEEDLGLLLPPELDPQEIASGTDEKIVQLLESNNKLIATFGQQMIALQEEMLALRRESLEFRTEFSDMQNEMADIQLAIQEIRSSNQIAQSNPGLRSLNTEDPYVVRFEKNSDHITLAYQLELNEVYHLLMLDPGRKVMITGYADQSGSADFNAQISRMRALSVKHYLRQKGIPSDRMIINFLGDSVSDSENPLDRKVEIAWLGTD
ncbi:MAG: OmpA family protein [Flavobacteriales bacterium]|nr:OmpA family protein [Flavobacteriales bacterium]